MASSEGMAVIGPSVKLRGDLSGTEDLEFHGDVEGSISLTGARLTVGAQGSVRGNVAAREVIVLGRVNGDIVAEERADLRASSVIEGKIFAPRLLIEPEAQLQVKVDPEGKPAKA
jgi:cytoskeletal protein CcmA (bactofilin family)